MRLSHCIRVALLVLLSHPTASMASASPAGVTSSALEARVSSRSAVRAEAVSGPVIGLSAFGHYFGRLNVGESSDPFVFTVSNNGYAPLTISALSHTNPGAGFSASMGPLPVTIPPFGGSATLTTSFTSMGSGLVSDNLEIQCNADNGDVSLHLQAIANSSPAFDPALPANVSASAFAPFSLVATATDPEGDALTWRLGSVPPLPVGATFDGTTGALSWTPGIADAGDYAVTITVDDGLAHTDGPFALHVLVTNHPPTANPGGPYDAITARPVALDGTASSDPDAGQTLTYSWDFGDGASGSGPTPSHTYAVQGVYFPSLTVTDNGTPPFSSTAIAAVTVVDFVALDIVQPAKALPIIKTSGNAMQRFGIECFPRPVTDVDQTTIRVSTSYPNAGIVSEIKVPVKGIKIGDLDGNSVGDLDFSLRPSDIKPLLLHVPNGARVTLLFRAFTIDIRPVLMLGSIDLTKSGSSNVTVAAAPNPFKPETSIKYVVGQDGPVTMRVFSVDGRLVRRLVDAEYRGAGDHEERWNGLNDGGERVAPGIYFVKTRAAEETSVLKLVVLK